jgi:hypothetical protein
MKLPNKEFAIINKEKLTNYLLAFEHRVGRSKAEFFTSFGFNGYSWEILRASLLEHASKNAIKTEQNTDFGARYTIEGIIETPDGRNPVIRTVWFIRNGEDIPRFVTAYPI